MSARWRSLSARERTAIGLAVAAAVLVALWLWLAPAVKTLRQAPTRLVQLDEQLAHMHALAREAAALRAAASPSTAQAREAVEAASARLGPAARLQWLGDRAVLQLERVPAAALAGWLGEVRAGARMQPQQVQLRRDAEALSGSVTVLRTAAP